MARERMRQEQSGRGASPDNRSIGIIGGSGLYTMPGLEKPREVRVKTPFGDPSDAFVVGTLEGQRVAFLARHGARASLPAIGDQLSRQYLRHEAAGRGTHYFRQRGRLAAGGFEAARFPDPRSVLRPHAPPHFHVFRRWRRGACGLRQAGVRATRRRAGRRLRRGEGAGPPRRHLHLHGRPAIFDAGRSACAPPVAISRLSA